MANHSRTDSQSGKACTLHHFPYLYFTPCKLERFIGIITLANWFKQIYSFSYIYTKTLFIPTTPLFIIFFSTFKNIQHTSLKASSSYCLAKLALQGLQS